jgi:P pilus assembly protein, chaperone PapD
MSKKALRASFAALLIGIAAASAGAFTLEPMTQLLSPSGEGSFATFRVKNDGVERAALRFSVLYRALSQEGREMNAPADDLFAVYPARLLLEPGATAAIKVQWRGSRALGSEQSFRFVAEQLPVDSRSSDGSSSSALKIMFRYIASLYVGEDSFVPKLSASVSGALGPEGETGYLVEIRNGGNRHVVAVDASVALSDGSMLSGPALGSLSGENYLPGTSRRVFVPSPDAVEGKDYEAKLSYEKAY